MLRVSAMNTETDVDLQGVNGDAASAAKGIEYGAELMSFAESLAQRDDQALASARMTLQRVAGDKVIVDAAGVAANFQRMVRIADSIGIPFDNMQSDFVNSIQAELGLGRFASAQHSKAVL